MNDKEKMILAFVDSLRNEIVRFTQNLIQIPSLPGKEQKTQEFVAAKLNELKLDVDILHSDIDELKHHPAFCDDGIPFDKRVNVVGCWRGNEPDQSHTNGNARSLILNGHIDVVPTGNEALWEDSPWSGKLKNGKLYGRGACDMKAGLASSIFAIEALQQTGFKPRKDVFIESVIGEETGGVGTLTTIVKGYRADAAIIMEPTQLKICPIQAGALTFRINVAGRSVHAAMKKAGVSAIEKFNLIFNALNNLERYRHSGYHNQLYEDQASVAPISIGTIKGGEWHSTVPDELIAEGRYGVLPGETIEAAKNAFTETLRKVTASDAWLTEHPPTLEWFEGQFESGQTDLNEPILQTLAISHQTVTTKTAKLRGVTYGSDLRLFTNHAKIPAVLYGPGNVADAHTVNEFVSLEEVVLCAKVLALTIYQWCGGGTAL